MILDAAEFAADRHRRQRRKDVHATPYINHPLALARLLANEGGVRDPEILAAALLHDTVEDTTTDYDDLLERFGPDVADCVAALTKNMALPEHLREPEYDQRLSRADWRTRLVKLADQYDNFCDAVSSREGVSEKHFHRCQRALRLALPDAENHPETARAIAALCELTGLSAEG